MKHHSKKHSKEREWYALQKAKYRWDKNCIGSFCMRGIRRAYRIIYRSFWGVHHWIWLNKRRNIGIWTQSLLISFLFWWWRCGLIYRMIGKNLWRTDLKLNDTAIITRNNTFICWTSFSPTMTKWVLPFKSSLNQGLIESALIHIKFTYLVKLIYVGGI